MKLVFVPLQSFTQVVVRIWFLSHDLNTLPLPATARPLHRLHHRLHVQAVLKRGRRGDRLPRPRPTLLVRFERVSQRRHHGAEPSEVRRRHVGDHRPGPPAVPQQQLLALALVALAVQLCPPGHQSPFGPHHHHLVRECPGHVEVQSHRATHAA